MNYFEDNETLAPSSIIQYNARLNKWISLMPKEKQDILHILLYPHESITYLTHLDNTNNTNLHTYYTAVRSYLHNTKYLPILIHSNTLRTLKDTWSKISSDNKAPIVHRMLQQKPTELQQKKEVPNSPFRILSKNAMNLKQGPSLNFFSLSTPICPLYVPIMAQ